MQVLSPIPELNLSGNIPDLIFLAQPNEVVTVALFKGDQVVIEEIYNPDSSNQIKIRYRDIIADELSAVVPAFNQSIYHQVNGYADFTLIATSNLGFSSELYFRVIKGEVSTDLLDTDNFLDSNFLTWQPQVKKVLYHDPEWMTYYARNTSLLKVTAYTFPDNIATTKTLAVLPAEQLTTVNLNYGLILSLFASVGIPQYYDVFVERSAKRLTYVQRYIFSQEKVEFNDLFVFANSLGGIDTIRFTGDAIVKQGYTFNKAVFDDQVLDYDQEHVIAIKKDTGYFTSKNEKLWSLDFFASLLKYKNQDGSLLRVYTEDPDLESLKGELANYTFTYIFSKTSEAMNLSREHQAPPLLQLDDSIDGGLFAMPPMINHYPYATTSDVIIPVQYPFESTWRKLSLNDLLRGTIAPGEGGDSESSNVVSGNFGEWTLLPVKSDQIQSEDIPLQFKADLVSFPKRAIVFIIGQFFLKPEFSGTEISLGILPAYARPIATITKYFITRNIEMYLSIGVDGSLSVLSKDGFPLPSGEGDAPYNVECFYNPDILVSTPTYTYARTETFRRTNCNEGQTGSEIQFTKLYEAQSMAEAEQLASADANYHSDGEAWANDPANGATCIANPVTIVYKSLRTQNFSRECGPGYIGSSVPFTKEYLSTISQADADFKAANDTANFNVLGQAYANDPTNGGTCSLERIFIWGRISEENVQTITGARYADIMLRTYKGSSATIPPAPVEQAEIVCTLNNIAISYRTEGTYTAGPNNYSVNIANTKVIRLVAPNTQQFNPVYPKQIISLPDGTYFYAAFAGKGRNEMVLLQTIN